jgi:hypothetical protein
LTLEREVFFPGKVATYFLGFAHKPLPAQIIRLLHKNSSFHSSTVVRTLDNIVRLRVRFPDMASRREVGAKILEEIEEELRQAKADLVQVQQKIKSLETEREAALVLAKGTRSVVLSNAPIRTLGGPVFVRTKNLASFAYAYLRDSAPPDGLTAVELHKALEATGSPVGRRNYIYDVLRKLESEKLVRKTENGKYVAVHG